MNLNGQFTEASRNVEIAAKGLINIATSHPIKVLPILGTIGNYLTTYFGAQKKGQGEKQWLIYTSEDDQIPFKPEWDTFYSYMVSQITTLTYEVVDMSKFKDVRKISALFRDLNHLGERMFNSMPTRMVRITDHERLSLHAVQALDAPLNCCPSLHIGYSVTIDNLCEHVLDLPNKKPDVWKNVRAASTGMFNSVLYTKQHSMIDVAFGILAAKIVLRKHYPHIPFNNFGEHLPPATDIPYKRIGELYYGANEIYGEELTKKSDLDPLVRTAKRVFAQEKYPLVNADDVDSEYARILRGAVN
jgi:hypothetical protein